MPDNNNELNSVNPHYLDRVINLSESKEVCASEDIFDANGMKLLSKGAPISQNTQEKLIRHKLRKPLETSLMVTEGVSIEAITGLASQLLEEIPSLRTCLAETSSHAKLHDFLSGIKLNNSASTLLSMAHNTQEQRGFRHAVLVSMIGTMLAIRAKFDSNEILNITHAALLHDIGEMYLAPDYLKSSAHLSPDEWKHVVVHPKVGQLVLQESTPYPPAIARAVGEHHERMNGSGYPHQFSGKHISKEGGFVAAAETLGGIFMHPNHAVQRACLAMKIIPGEFAPDAVSVISSTAQSLTDNMSLESVKPISDQSSHLHNLHQKLANVTAQCDNLASASMSHKKIFIETQQLVSSRLGTIKRSLASSGIGACLVSPQLVIDDFTPEILLELEVVSKEMEWRLRDIARDLALRLSRQDPEVTSLFTELIETLDKPTQI